MALIITGVLSMVWAICWLIFYKHPKNQKRLSNQERDYILSGQETQHQTGNRKKMSAWEILHNRQFWGMRWPRFLAEPAWGTFNAWSPLFMFKVYGFGPLFVCLAVFDLLGAVVIWTVLKNHTAAETGARSLHNQNAPA